MNGDSFWRELEEILADDFHGQIILHCNAGQVRRYEVRQTKLPRTGSVDITEQRDLRASGE